MRLRTRVFSLMVQEGYRTYKALADAMDVPPSAVSRTLDYEMDPAEGKGQEPTKTFIKGALRAFPGRTFEDLFYVESTDDRELAEAIR